MPWTFGFLAFKPPGIDTWPSLASKPLFLIMACLVAPSAIWLTLSRLGRATGSNEKMSPDSVSALFPDRPIRPLPKRRLRERLSPDVADTIKYPIEPQNNAPLFYYPYSLKAEERAAHADSVSLAHRDANLDLAQEADLRRNGLGGEYDEDGPMYQGRRSLVSRPYHESSGHALRTPPRTSQGRHHTPQAPPSTASSADGYDSFENTNNKKKRKIPIAGEHMLSGSHILGDTSILGVPSPPTTGDEGPGDALAGSPSSYAYSGVGGANAQGISGPGRGRYGRNRNGRSPMRQLSDTNANWSVKNSRPRSEIQYATPQGEFFRSAFSPTSEPNLTQVPGEKKGIISSAIASAGKLPLPEGQENISLLQHQQQRQQTSNKGSPTSSQFTFTFDSQVSGSVPWPGSESSSPHMANKRVPVHGSQGGPYHSANTRPLQNGHTTGPQAGPTSTTDSLGKASLPANASPKKHRRRGNPLLLAAKQRRQDQEYKNYHHPPTPEEAWICEFCEYERIFGRPPEALIRQYEIKDRRRRREEAERRRLLEKAKMKSRKGKKPSKLPAKNNAVAHDRNAAHPAGYQAPPMDQGPSNETHSEAFDEDDYYEDDVHDENCPVNVPGDNFESHASLAGDGTVDGGTRDNRVPVT